MCIRDRKMPNAPACVDPSSTDVVYVCAMMRGTTGRNVWLDIGSLKWVVAFAADELAHSGLSTFRNIEHRRPNFSSVPGVWKTYDHMSRWIMFQFVEEVPGLPAGTLNVRRYLPIVNLTDAVWDKYPYCTRSLENATLRDKHDVARRIIVAWCHAIFAGTEDQFIAEHDFPHWRCNFRGHSPTSAQAADPAGPPTSAQAADPASPPTTFYPVKAEMGVITRRK